MPCHRLFTSKSWRAAKVWIRFREACHIANSSVPRANSAAKRWCRGSPAPGRTSPAPGAQAIVPYDPSGRSAHTSISSATRRKGDERCTDPLQRRMPQREEIVRAKACLRRSRRWPSKPASVLRKPGDRPAALHHARRARRKNVGASSPMALRTTATTGVDFRHLVQRKHRVAGIYGSGGQALRNSSRCRTTQDRNPQDLQPPC
jgi:hypothetical protein